MNENFPKIKLEVVILHASDSPSEWALKLSEKFNVSFYKVSNDSDDKYKCQYKPLGMHLRRNDSSKIKLEHVLAIDSDVILNKHLDYHTLIGYNECIMSDCSSYLDYNYLKKNLTDEQITKIGDVAGISLDEIKSIKKVGGAQYLYNDINKYPKDFFEKIAKDSIEMYTILNQFAEEGSHIQKWTAEMWATIWNIHKTFKYRIETEIMSFAWATTPIVEKNKYMFTHFSGSPPDDGTFRKSKHNGNVFKEDLSYVTFTENCSYYYYTLIEKYRSKSIGATLD